MHESGMDDTDSIIANVDITPPVQIHQLAAFLWNILNNDREANMVILERLEDTDDDPSRHPVQIFSAADLVHLASHLAESSRTFVERSTSHGDQCSNLPEPRVPKLEHIFVVSARCLSAGRTWTPEWTSRDSNHHRQSVSAGKTNAIPTEPSGRLAKLEQQGFRNCSKA